jgi:hypothetical protein
MPKKQSAEHPPASRSRDAKRVNKLVHELAMRVIDIPLFLVRPRAALTKLFGDDYWEGAGLVAGVAYLV